MKYKGLYNRFLFIAIAVCAAFLSCTMMDEPDLREKEYGYVQFKLYKAVSYPVKSTVDWDNDELIDSLSCVAKMEVQLEYEGIQMVQTLVMNSFDYNNAEFGLRSDKLKLLAGDYKVISYVLYDKLDNKIRIPNPTGWSREFTVVAGGLCTHDLLANVGPKGLVKFTFVKDEKSFPDKPDVKSTGGGQVREFTMDEVKTVTIKVVSDNVPVTFEKLPVKFSVHFDEDDDYSKESGYRTSSLSCDSLMVLKAGEYVVEEYILYDEYKNPVEVNNNVSQTTFNITDNGRTEVKVPVRLYDVNEYIKDYYALYEIWKSLNGNKWYYSGQDYPKGANWDFNKDPDLWGDQPGVSLHSNGRVALINISDFGFSGILPDAISQLSELTELYLGTHNDMNQNDFVDPTIQPGSRNRLERHKQYLAHKYPAVQFSEPIARGLKEHNIHLPEIAMYDTMTESQIIDVKTGDMKVALKDVAQGKLYNGLTEISPAIWKLDKLEKLMIANGKLVRFPTKPTDMDDRTGLMALTDLEIFNCRDLELPKEALSQMPSLISLNLSYNNASWSSEQANDLLHSLAEGESAKKIQILYMNNSNLTEVDGEKLAKMKSLGLLDLSDNKIKSITPLVDVEGNAINIIQLHLNNNLIEKLERHSTHGCFCGISDVETFSVRNNLLTEFPDIFDAKSKFGMTSVDFSYNKIEKFAGYSKEGTKVGENKGIYVETLTLANNPITTYPLVFRDTESKLAYINMRGCELTEIPDSAFLYDNAVYLTSFDFSYNHLSKFPMNFHAGNIPYLYGLDISYNMFKEFPYEQFDMRGLTVFAIRGQRDENGDRCLTEWPTGVYNHVGLRGLYLGSNDIRKVDDTISTLCYYLDISDNPNIVFDASDICYAWQVGAYYLICDKDQDIRNCDIMMN